MTYLKKNTTNYFKKKVPEVNMYRFEISVVTQKLGFYLQIIIVRVGNRGRGDKDI